MELKAGYYGPRTEPFPLLHISYNYDASRRMGLQHQNVMTTVSSQYDSDVAWIR